MTPDREQRLAENAWHLNQAAIELERVATGPDLGIDEETRARLKLELAQLRNKCITAPPSEGGTPCP